MEPEGCQYRESEGQSRCNKICSPGQILCPYHLLLKEAEPAKQQRRSYATPRGYRE